MLIAKVSRAKQRLPRHLGLTAAEEQKNVPLNSRGRGRSQEAATLE